MTLNSKFSSSTLFRLKVGHGCFPQHLNRLGVADSPCCSCDDLTIGDLNHLFFACPLYSIPREILIDSLLKLGIQLPINLVSLLHLDNRDVNYTLLRYLKDSQIKI